jgi:antitoxin (DNA-binding transcriptional repressor) of toxin-antitoxin stability system
MSATITVAEAQAKLPELIHKLAPGDELVLTENHRPVARLIAAAGPRKARKAGSAKGKLIILQEDEEHLKDFEEYMK